MATMGTGRKTSPYAIGVATQVIYAATIVISKASFDQGLSVFVYILYRQAAACLVLLPVAILLERRNVPPMSFRLLLKMFLYSLVNTLGSCLYNTSLKYTSATAAAAICSSIPVITFFLALLLRMEALKLKSSPGMAKVAGITLCLAGVLVIALYAGPSLRPLNRHRVLTDNGGKHAAGVVSKSRWIMGTFLMFIACVAWSLWFIFQGLLLKEYPNKLLAALILCLFGTIQSFPIAVIMERDHGFSRWKLGLDLSLVSVAFAAWCVDMKGPVFLAMWNPLNLLLTVFCSSLLGQTIHLGSVLGGILLVGGLYSVLWGKSKEETRSAMPPDQHEEQSSSKDKQLLDAKECEAPDQHEEQSSSKDKQLLDAKECEAKEQV